MAMKKIPGVLTSAVAVLGLVIASATSALASPASHAAVKPALTRVGYIGLQTYNDQYCIQYNSKGGAGTPVISAPAGACTFFDEVQNAEGQYIFEDSYNTNLAVGLVGGYTELVPITGQSSIFFNYGGSYVGSNAITFVQLKFADAGGYWQWDAQGDRGQQSFTSNTRDAFDLR